MKNYPHQPSEQPSNRDCISTDSRYEHHVMAMRVTTMSLMLYGEKYIELHNSVDHLPEERRDQINKIRKKRFTSRSAKQENVRSTHEEHVKHAQELVFDMQESLIRLDEIRGRFYQQIEDTQQSGFTHLAEHYASRLLFLETKGAEALSKLQVDEKDVVEVKLLEVLIERIKNTRDALVQQMEWLPELRKLVEDSSSQYQSIMQIAY
jgi:hypothetical protein